jgi:pimeloyl-ACP methyl ester carboxylesterase
LHEGIVNQRKLFFFEKKNQKTFANWASARLGETLLAIQYPLALGTYTTRIIEAGTGPAVMFVHGLGARADRWRGTVERVAKAGYRAIAWDLHGHGFASKEADGPANVPALAAQLWSILDRLEIGPVVLVGTSLGAHIAAYAACEQPGRIGGIAMVGALGVVPIPQVTAEAIRRNVQAASREQILAKLRFVIIDPAQVPDALVEEEWRINNAPGALAAFGRLGEYLANGIARDYVAERLAALFPPDRLLLIWGAADAAVPLAVGEECRAALNNPDLCLIEGAGHAPYYEQPEKFDPPLLRFIAHCRSDVG